MPEAETRSTRSMESPFCHLTALSAELQNQIVDFLLLQGDVSLLRSLSRTCSFYQSLLAPYILKAVHLVNSSKGGLSVDAVARGRYRGCVQVLHYQGLAPGDSDDQFSNVEAIFPDIVGRVLSNLQRFPNLSTVMFEFPFDWDEWEEGWELFNEPESSDGVQAAENAEGWRALMLQSFDALSRNTTSSIEDFEIKGLVAKEVSTFNSEGFHNFLGRLKRFRVSIRDWDNGAGWAMNTQAGFADFAEQLAEFFFDHLQSATDVVLEADETAPLGLEPGRYHVHLALKPQQMPLLRKLELRYIFVCPELANFLVAHLETLEELVMTNCLCSMELLDEDTEGMHWDALFNAVSEGQPRKLRRLEIVSTEEIGIEIPQYCDQDKVKEMLEALADDPNRRLFAYINLDDKYGMLMEDEDMELESFRRGHDQRAYDRLMAIVGGNRQKGDKADMTAA